MFVYNIQFEGRVQGVGFRYTTQRLAKSMGLNGWVRNCSDGSVQASVDASEQDVQKLIEGLKAHFPGGVHKVFCEQRESLEEFDGFAIRT